MKKALLAVAVLSGAIWVTTARVVTACPECADLAVLTRELAEQTFLMGVFERWASTGKHPPTIDDVQTAAKADLAEYVDRTGSGGGGAGGSAAGPALGTDLSTPACNLVEYVTDSQGRTVARPTTPQQVRRTFCKPIAEFLLTHENSHRQSCLQAWRNGTQSLLQTVDFFVKDDADAYAAGVKVLQDYVDAARKKCTFGLGIGSDTMSGARKAPRPCCAQR